MKVANLNYYFLLFLGVLIFLLYPLTIWIDRHIQLSPITTFFGMIFFIIFYIIFILIGKENTFFIVLRKSIFSKNTFFIVLISYMISVAFVHYSTKEKIKEIENHYISNDIDAKLVTTIENSLLLRTAPIVDIKNKITLEKLNQLISKEYTTNNNVAFRFLLDEDSNNKSNRYTIYFDKQNISFNILLLYLFLTVFFYFFYKMNQKNSTKWGKIKELIGAGIILFIFFGIALTSLSQSYWHKNTLLSKSFLKDKILLQSDEKIIIKGE